MKSPLSSLPKWWVFEALGLFVMVSIALVHGQGSQLDQDSGSPCYLQDENGQDDVNKPQVSQNEKLNEH